MTVFTPECVLPGLHNKPICCRKLGGFPQTRTRIETGVSAITAIKEQRHSERSSNLDDPPESLPESSQFILGAPPWRRAETQVVHRAQSSLLDIRGART